MPHFPDGVFQDCRAVQMGIATMMQKRRHARRTGRSGPVNAAGADMRDAARDTTGGFPAKLRNSRAR